jgi:thymidylate synthase (FAD)
MKAEYIDHMGSDLTVVNAARVSFDKESCWREVGEPSLLYPNDEKLIGYLARHNHWTPFGHCVVTLRETVPIFVARQRFKHVIGFTYNEVSRRYVDDAPEFFQPETWRGRAENKKQGSSDEDVSLAVSFAFHLEGFHNECLRNYRLLLECGVAPEQARMVLPQSMYTSYYVTGSLAAWIRAYRLRSDPHAQKEIQDLAHMWNEIINPLFPHSWKALCST